ncbi:MAG: CDP-alcohol phosphatidyltransferase family protein [Acidobacteriota bacterium]|nr:CDP-alcohol phosphatidyltransferase family protein [Acidobacteriota bacterium]
MANVLTTVRLLLIAPFALFMLRGDARSAAIALIIWAIALATDFVDGPVARRRGTSTAGSKMFDHATDFLFVTGGIFAGAARGAFPWVLPALITAAFAQYAVDSYRIQPQSGLRGNPLGRYNGILYFVPPCADILIRLGWVSLRPALTIFVWLLVASTAVSMAQRLSYLALPENLSRRSSQK